MSEPIKRNEALKPISRDHHHALLLGWKIRQGIKNKIPAERIKKYVDWFWSSYLENHFELEEKNLYPVLGAEHASIKKAMQHHEKLRNLFLSKEQTIQQLDELQNELDRHIRFEERELFNEIQNAASAKQLQDMAAVHNEAFHDNYSDEFWVIKK